MNDLTIKPYLIRLYLIVVGLFVINKLVVLSFVLDHDVPAFLTIPTLSIPNTFEAIIGAGLLAGILMMAWHRLRSASTPCRMGRSISWQPCWPGCM